MDMDLYLQNQDYVAIYSFWENDTYVYVVKCRTFERKPNLVKKSILRSITSHKSRKIVFDYFSPDYVEQIFNQKQDNLNFVFIEINRKCNLGCIHCYLSQNDKGAHLTYDRFDEIINIIKDKQPIDIRIIGGEPSLVEDLCGMCKRAMGIQPKSHHTLLTNGSMSEESLRGIMETGINIQISVYGMTYRTFETFSHGKKKDFDRVFENLEILSKEYLNKVKLVFINSSVTKNELDHFIKFATEKGFSYSYGNVVSIGRAKINQNLLGNVEEINQERMTCSVKPKYEQKLSNRICDLDRLCICANGDITPCHYFQIHDTNYTMGNIFNSSLDDILWSKKFNDFRSHTVDDVKTCNKCIFRYLCSAGCCGETYAVKGDILEKYTHCCLDKCLSDVEEDTVYRIVKYCPGLFYKDKIL